MGRAAIRFAIDRKIAATVEAIAPLHRSGRNLPKSHPKLAAVSKEHRAILRGLRDFPSCVVMESKVVFCESGDKRGTHHPGRAANGEWKSAVNAFMFDSAIGRISIIWIQSESLASTTARAVGVIRTIPGAV